MKPGVDLLRGGYAGSIPASYDRYLRPFLFERFAADLVSRLRTFQGMRVLEIACGTGVVTEQLRRALPPGSKVVATDLQPGMLDCARARLGSDNLEWREADAAALPFDDASFDAVLCQFGWMFFPDKTLCAREARRVLARGGQLLLNVWAPFERNEPAGIFQRALESILGDDAPAFLKTPFGYGDPDMIAAWLTDAGFERVRVELVELDCTSSSAEDIANGFLLGTPVFNELKNMGPEAMAALGETIAGDLAKRYGSGPVVAPLTAYVAEAIAP